MEKDPFKCISARALLGEGCRHHGFVGKKGGRLTPPKTKFFILHQGCLYFYKDFNSTKEEGAVCLAGYELKEDLQDDDLFGINLVPMRQGRKPICFYLPTNDEKKVWIEKLNQEMHRIAGDGGEDYNYCYEGRAQVEAEVHNYEPTDEIDSMPPPRGMNSYAKQPGGAVSSAMPLVPPPSRPERIGGSKGIPSSGNNTNQFMPPKVAPKGAAVAPPTGGSALPPKRNAPKPPAEAFVPPPMPNPRTKPVGMNPLCFSNDDYAKKKTGVEELVRKMEQKRALQMKYEVHNFKEKPVSNSDDSDSEGSESYLDLDGEGGTIVRGRPAGSSQNKHYEKPRASSDMVLPLSVFQETLSRETSESLLIGIQQDGMYLIRRGSSGDQVLTVYTPAGCKHYKIFDNSGSVFLKDGEPSFQSLERLVTYYYTNRLPTCEYKLRMPYG